MALRLLLDEDTERGLASKLSNAEHDVERVVNVETLGAGAGDDEIREYAVATGRIVVTHDKDYLRFDSNRHPGVFFAPNQRLSAHRLFIIIQAVERAHKSTRFGPVVFLTEQWLSE